MNTLCLIISISGRRLGVNLEDVEEVAERGTITLLPRLPTVMPGVIEVQGRAIPVIDLGVLSGDPPRHDHRFVLVATDGHRPLAVLVDEVEWVDDAEKLAPEEDVPLLDLRQVMEGMV